MSVQVDGITSEPRTTLKYAIEVALPRTTRLLGVLEPFLERVVYEVRTPASACFHFSCCTLIEVHHAQQKCLLHKDQHKLARRTYHSTWRP